MKVNVMKKATITNLTHGFRYSTDVEKFENVSSVAEVTNSNNKLYQITYNNGSSSATATFAQSDYIINIVP